MYDKFIQKYKNQVIPTSVYTEKHHILPKHVGGTNEQDNIIVLTYRQHILAHLLLYRKYRRIEDITAYKLMVGIPEDRKSTICKMIGERHIQSGHIQTLGKKNAETGFINSIKTPESLRRGGLKAGKIAKETGQIYTIRTTESSRRGGITQGNKAKENGQIQSLGKYKGLYVLIAPDGIEYQHGFQMAAALGIHPSLVISRCANNQLGFSRRKKTQEELDNRWTNVV